jgi:hypothetical protein
MELRGRGHSLVVHKKEKDVLTQHQLQEIIRYEPETGKFYWQKPPSNKHFLVGTVAGSIYANGYRYIQINGTSYRSGRLAWLYMKGVWPEAFVDHKDLNKANDAWDNLRLASDSQNQANRGNMCTNTSGTKGIRFEASRRKWRAQITVNGKSRNLGRYSTREEAMLAYERAAKVAWGEFARTG